MFASYVCNLISWDPNMDTGSHICTITQHKAPASCVTCECTVSCVQSRPRSDKKKRQLHFHGTDGEWIRVEVCPWQQTWQICIVCIDLSSSRLRKVRNLSHFPISRSWTSHQALIRVAGGPRWEAAGERWSQYVLSWPLSCSEDLLADSGMTSPGGPFVPPMPFFFW